MPATRATAGAADRDRAAVARRWPIWSVVLLFAVAWLVLCWPWLSGRVTVPWDAKAHFQAQLQFLADSLHHGEAPFWNPFVFAGMPQIADPQSLIFSPPHLLLAAFDATPSFRQADGVAFLMLFLGGLGLILIFRDHGWHPAGALVAAMAFTFGASAAWRIQHTGQILSLSYFPLALWSLRRALERRSPVTGFLAGALAGLMVLGRDQIAWLGVWLLAGFVLWHLLRAPSFAAALRSALAPLLSGVVGGTLVVGWPLLMTVLLAGDSNRPSIDLAGAGRGSLHPASFLTVFVANLYGTDGPLADFWGQPSIAWGPTELFLARNMSNVYIGAIPALALIAAVVAGGGWRKREIRYSLVALGFLVLYALGWHTPVFAELFKLMPGADLFRRPADATFLIGAMAALAAGYGVHRLVTGPSPGRTELLAAAALTLGGLAACIGLAAWKDKLAQAATPIAVAVLLFAAAAGALWGARRIGGRRPLAAAALLGAVLTADLAWSNGPNESTALPPSVYDALRPDTQDPLVRFLVDKTAGERALDRRDRVELAGIDFHWPNASMVHRLDNTLGYNPLRLSLYAKATGAQDHAALPDQRVFAPLFPGYRSLLSDMLGLRWIATRGDLTAIDTAATPDSLPEVGRFPAGRVYENPGALPRVAFVGEARQADFAGILASGRWPEFDPRRTVLLEDPPATASSAGPGPAGHATLRSYRNTEVVVHVRAERPGWVVLNDIWHPWWYAEVDGKPAPLLRANVLFRAVAAPAGEHEVRFTFRPVSGTLDEVAARLGWAGHPAMPP